MCVDRALLAKSGQHSRDRVVVGGGPAGLVVAKLLDWAARLLGGEGAPNCKSQQDGSDLVRIHADAMGACLTCKFMYLAVRGACWSQVKLVVVGGGGGAEILAHSLAHAGQLDTAYLAGIEIQLCAANATGGAELSERRCAR